MQQTLDILSINARTQPLNKPSPMLRVFQTLSLLLLGSSQRLDHGFQQEAGWPNVTRQFILFGCLADHALIAESRRAQFRRILLLN
jgi:hypothetical protein